MEVELVTRCCVCTHKVRAKYERTKVGEKIYQFRCLTPPVHEDCKRLFEELKAEKSGNRGPTAGLSAAAAGVM